MHPSMAAYPLVIDFMVIYDRLNSLDAAVDRLNKRSKQSRELLPSLAKEGSIEQLIDDIDEMIKCRLFCADVLPVIEQMAQCGEVILGQRHHSYQALGVRFCDTADVNLTQLRRMQERVADFVNSSVDRAKIQLSLVSFGFILYHPSTSRKFEVAVLRC
jgi:hypothetical protein